MAETFPLEIVAVQVAAVPPPQRLAPVIG